MLKKEKRCNCCGKKLESIYFRCAKCGVLVCGQCMMRTRGLECFTCQDGYYVKETQ